MKLPHPFCGGLCDIVDGGLSLAVFHTLFGVLMAMLYPIIRCVASLNQVAETGTGNTISNIILGLMFNSIMNAVLIRAMIMNHVTACRTWLVLGILGAVACSYAVYDMPTHGVSSGLQHPLTEGVSSIIVAFAIYHAYVWYVIYSFTSGISQPKIKLSPVPRTRSQVPVASDIVATTQIIELQTADGVDETKIDIDIPPKYSECLSEPDVATLGDPSSY